MKHRPKNTNPCPSCNVNISGASGHDEAPTVGDVSICFYCGAILEFSSDMTLKKANRLHFEAHEWQQLERLSKRLMKAAGKHRDNMH